MLKNTCPFSLYLTSLRPGLLAPVSVARVDLIGDTPEKNLFNPICGWVENIHKEVGGTSSKH